MKNAINFFVNRSLFGNLVTVGVLLAGIITLFSMRREAFPNIDFDIVVVTSIYPGASPQEVEKLITIPVEREIKSVDNIKETSSTSLYSRSAVVLTLEPGIDDKLQVLQDIRDAVDRAKVEFPEDAEEPLVQEISTSRTPVLEVALNSKKGTEKELSETQLRDIASRLEDELELIDDVASITTRGYREREIHVEVDPAKMSAMNISVDEITSALANRNLNFPGGSVRDGGKEYTIRTVKEFENKQEIENLIIRANDLGFWVGGGIVRLKDIAKVHDTYEIVEQEEKANGRKAIILTVLQKEKGDAINIVDAVKKQIKDFTKDMPEELEVSLINDLSYYIRRRLQVLTSNVVIGLVLVLVSLFFFLGWRISLMVALGIPFSFAITFLVMGYFDMSINLISMFGLVIVSGMIVDDAIVVGENIYRHIEKGRHPVQAAREGAAEMVAPVFGSISTTIVAFAPLMFMSGIMGKFVWSIPAAVIIALAASLYESFFILPAHISDVTRNVDRKKILKNEQSFEARFFKRLQNIYRPILEWSLKRRYFLMVTVFFLFIVAAAMITVTGFILFPKGGIEVFIIKTEAPAGISLETMDKFIEPVEDAARALPEEELDSVISRVGIHQESPSDPFTKRGENYAQVMVYLTPEPQRDRRASEIIAYLKRQVDPDRTIVTLSTASTGNGKSVLKLANSEPLTVYEKARDFENGREIEIADSYLLGAGLLKDGKTLYALSARNMLYRYNLETSEAVELGDLSVRDFDFADRFMVEPTGKFALVSTDMGHFYKVSLEDASRSSSEGPQSKITSYRFLSEKQEVLFTTDQGSIEFFSYESGDLEPVLKQRLAPRMIKKDGQFTFNPKQPVFMPAINYAAQGTGDNLWYLASHDGVIRLFDRAKNSVTQSHKINDAAIYWLALDPSSNDRIWVSQKDLLIHYDMQKQAVLSETAVTGTITHAVYNDNALTLVGTHSLVAEISATGRLTVLKQGQRTIEKLEFKQAGGGPPVGAPVQIELRGDSFETLLEISEIAKEKLTNIDGVYDIRDNWEQGKEEYHVNINEVLAAQAGVSVRQIATTLQAAFDGRVATSIKRADEEIDIRVLFPEELREKLSSLKKVMVRNMTGNLVPITVLADFEKKQGVSLITHSDFRRTVYVKANIDETRNSSVKVNTEIMNQMKTVMAKYPGYQLIAGGEYKDTQESMRDLMQSAGIAGLGILGILVLLFGNLRHPRVIMAAIPLGFIGVSYAFFAHKMFFLPNLTFSFLASMGIVGLSGVVVNDSIVLVDFINRLRKAGLNKHDSIVAAGLYRLRAVILTTVTTVFGLVPTAYGIGGSDPFLKPMALAMAWGLAFATLITLLVIPAYYAIWEDRGFVFHHVIGKGLRRLRKPGKNKRPMQAAQSTGEQGGQNGQ